MATNEIRFEESFQCLHVSKLLVKFLWPKGIFNTFYEKLKTSQAILEAFFVLV